MPSHAAMTTDRPTNDQADAEAEITLTLPPQSQGLRFDLALAQALPRYSRNRLKGWIEAGRVTVDARLADPRKKVGGGEQVVVRPVATGTPTSLPAQDIGLSIPYEDDALLVVDK